MGTVEPPRAAPDELQRRLQAVQARLALRRELSVSAPELIYYLTGWEPSRGRGEAPSRLVVSETAAWLADAPASVVPPWIEVRRSGARQAPAAPDLSTNDHELVRQAARPKSPGELSLIREALMGNDAAFSAVARTLRAGTPDHELASVCRRVMSRASGLDVAFEGCVGMGAAGAQPDAVPSGVVARPGDTVFVDLWSRRRHYAGDSTRSFTVGPAPSWALHAHEALLAALEAVETLLIPGAPVAEVDRRCRDTVRSRAGEATYRHHTGHGLGLTAGEPPLIDEGSPGELCEGEVIAIEPGVYVAGRGGLRLEEVYLITSAGPRALTGFARRLTECATGGEGGGEAAPAKPV